VWAEVDGVNKWVTYFDKYYWVIATLTDNVGNKTVYRGIVSPSTDKTKNYVYNFAEIYHPTDKTWCWCYAEDWSAADDVLGDCAETPATACWSEPLDPCPEVTVVPAEPMVGELATITIDYTDAVKPDGAVSAYVGPSIKTLPLGIPEEAQELVLTDNEDDTYTATYTFNQAGTDYIYVVDGCGDCTPCKTGITIAAAVCPTIAIEDEVEYLEEMWIDGGEHEVTITYAVPTEGVRLFYSPEPVVFTSAVIPAATIEIALESDDNMTFTGTVYFTGIGFEECDTEWLYVLSGDSCCPVVCSSTVRVDYGDPCVELAVAVTDCSDCDTACEVWISSDTCAYDTADCPCTSATECCETCTTFDWTLTVYDGQPQVEDDCDDCVEDDCSVEIASASGTGCEVDLNVFGCLTEAEWAALETEYYVIFTATDIVGNTFTNNGVLTVDTSDCSLTVLNDAVETDCEWTPGSGNIMGDCSCSSCFACAN